MQVDCRGFRRLTSLFLMTALLFTFPFSSGAATAEPDESVPVRAGLYYGSSAAPSFNLQNVTGYGSGYRLGYFDESLSFVQLGYTEEVHVSVLKTTNLYYSADTRSYIMEETAEGTVGCWHVQLPGEYADFESVKAVADAAGGFVTWIAGLYYVRVGSYTSAEAAAEAALSYEGGTAAETSPYGLSMVITGTTDILFQFDDLGEGTGFGVKPGLNDEVKTQTWCKSYRYFGAFRYQRITGANITLVNLVDMDDYVNCVISREMSDSWPLEALKAQAVCARNYYAVKQGRHSAHGFDICATTHCQVYSGTSATGENTARAAAETAGEYLWYGDGLVETYYFSSSGGTTENSENVWTAEIPYLRGIVDTYEPLIASRISNYEWTTTFTGKELQAKLVASGRANCGRITSVTLTSTHMGNVASITFHDENGKNWTLYKDDCRTVLGMLSMRFGLEDGPGVPGETAMSGSAFANNGETVDLSQGLFAIDSSGNVVEVTGTPYILTADCVTTLGDIQIGPVCGGSVTAEGDTFVFSGRGWGHNVGMSQWGARAMAEQGLTYRDILAFYYTGATFHDIEDIGL